MQDFGVREKNVENRLIFREDAVTDLDGPVFTGHRVPCTLDTGCN